MTLLEIQAIRALPEEYVVEGVRFVSSGKDFFVGRPGLPMLMYHHASKQWLDAMSAKYVEAGCIPEGLVPLAVKTGKLTKTEAETMGLPCEPKGDVGKLFD